MTDATDPQAQISQPELTGDVSAAVRTGLPTPTPQQLNESYSQGAAGDAVSAQPTDTDSGDLCEARERSGWDEDTDGGAGQRRLDG